MILFVVTAGYMVGKSMSGSMINTDDGLSTLESKVPKIHASGVFAGVATGAMIGGSIVGLPGAIAGGVAGGIAGYAGSNRALEKPIYDAKKEDIELQQKIRDSKELNERDLKILTSP